MVQYFTGFFGRDGSWFVVDPLWVFVERSGQFTDYTVLIWWAFFARVYLVANYKTASANCLDFWRNEGLGDYMVLMEKETGMLVWFAIAAAPVLPYAVVICCFCLANASKE